MLIQADQIETDGQSWHGGHDRQRQRDGEMRERHTVRTVWHGGRDR